MSRFHGFGVTGGGVSEGEEKEGLIKPGRYWQVCIPQLNEAVGSRAGLPLSWEQGKSVCHLRE